MLPVLTRPHLVAACKDWPSATPSVTLGASPLKTVMKRTLPCLGIAAAAGLLLGSPTRAPLAPARAAGLLLASILVFGPMQPGPPDVSATTRS